MVLKRYEKLADFSCARCDKLSYPCCAGYPDASESGAPITLKACYHCLSEQAECDLPLRQVFFEPSSASYLELKAEHVLRHPWAEDVAHAKRARPERWDSLDTFLDDAREQKPRIREASVLPVRLDTPPKAHTIHEEVMYSPSTTPEKRRYDGTNPGDVFKGFPPYRAGVKKRLKRGGAAYGPPLSLEELEDAEHGWRSRLDADGRPIAGVTALAAVSTAAGSSAPRRAPASRTPRHATSGSAPKRSFGSSARRPAQSTASSRQAIAMAAATASVSVTGVPFVTATASASVIAAASSNGQAIAMAGATASVGLTTSASASVTATASNTVTATASIHVSTSTSSSRPSWPAPPSPEPECDCGCANWTAEDDDAWFGWLDTPRARKAVSAFNQALKPHGRRKTAKSKSSTTTRTAQDPLPRIGHARRLAIEDAPSVSTIPAQAPRRQILPPPTSQAQAQADHDRAASRRTDAELMAVSSERAALKARLDETGRTVRDAQRQYAAKGAEEMVLRKRSVAAYIQADVARRTAGEGGGDDL